MSRKDVTADLSEKVAKKLRRQFAIVAQEVWVDADHRVDFVAFSPGSGGRNAALEHGRREDSTLCLLWSMLMDSYSRWRTTGYVFSEMGENCDL